MTELPARSTPWHVSQVIELSADLAEIALPWVESGIVIDDAHLFHFWGEGRQLTTDWLRRVDLLESTRQRRVAVDRDLILATLAHELFAIEMPARVLATTISALDRQRGTPEYRPIAEHVVFSIQHVRLRLLSLILADGESHAPSDRFRRRCERWTDMLIGPCLVRFGAAAFAHDPRRSWEFGEDLLSDAGLDVVQQLVRPSLLAAFNGAAGRSPIQSRSGDAFLQAILAMIPASLMTARLSRWGVAVDSDLPQVLPFRKPAASLEEEPGGWSLLDRCLQLVEWRRTRGE